MDDKREIFEEAAMQLPSSRCSRTAAANTTASISTCRCATCCRSRPRSRIRRCGSPARNSTRSPMPASGAWARWASSSCRPMPPMPGCTPTTTPSSSGRTSLPTIRPIQISPSSRSSCARKPMKKRARGRRRDVLPVLRCAITAPAAAASARRQARSTCGTNTTSGKRPTRKPMRRALRGGLIGSPETIRRKLQQVPGVEHRPGRPAQPGRQEHPRAYLRKP